MSQRLVQICRGEVLTPQQCERYRANWQAMAEGRFGVGPGTELHKIFALLGAMPTASCLCAERMAEMDRRGVEGCRQTREEVLGWLREAYNEADVISKARAWVNAKRQGLPLTLEGLLELALELGGEPPRAN